MTVQTLTRLVRARYRLQWAKFRGSALNMSVFLAAQGLVFLFVVVTAGSGLAGAAVAVRLGRAESIAQILLGTVFLNALVASVFLGFGMTQLFSDAFLRRYPLSRGDRFLTRQLLGLFEPLWLFTAAMYFGTAVGFWVMGAAPIWRTLPAPLLLLACNYLLARLLTAFIDRAMAIPGGQLALLVLINIVVLPLTFLRSVDWTVHIREHLTAALAITPPYAAAAMIGGSGAPWHPSVLAAWIVLLGGALLLIESRATPSRSFDRAAPAAKGLFDRVASVFTVLHPPLVSKTLRCFLRNPRVRWNLVVGPLLGAFLLRRGGAADTATVVGPLVISGLIGTLPTIDFDTNIFGYDSSGTRRLLLLPKPIVDVLRTLSATSLLLGLTYALFTVFAWSFFFPALADSRALGLMAGAAVGGALLLRGVGLWTSVLLPAAADYGILFGRQRNTGIGIHVVTFGAFMLVMVTSIATRGVGWNTAIRYWWVAPIAALVCGVFYLACLEGAGRVLMQRRERVLVAVEGRG